MFKTNNKMKIQDFASRLFEARITYHVMHLQTLSFAQHMALNDLYSNIIKSILNIDNYNVFRVNNENEICNNIQKIMDF